MKNKTSHYVYRLDCPSTGEYYLGLRSCSCSPDRDRYMGSGRIIRSKVRKHPEAWAKTILDVFDTREEAAAAEAELVTSEVLADPLCLNLKTGGETGQEYSGESRQKIAESWERRKADPEMVRRNAEGGKKRSECPVWRANITEGNRRQYDDPARVEQNRRTSVEHPNCIERNNRLAEINRDPDKIRRQLETRATHPTWRDNVGKATAERWADPEKREIMMMSIREARREKRLYTDEQVREMRRLYALPKGERPTQKQLVEQFGGNQPLISLILRGKRYTDVS